MQKFEVRIENDRARLESYRPQEFRSWTTHNHSTGERFIICAVHLYFDRGPVKRSGPGNRPAAAFFLPVSSSTANRARRAIQSTEQRTTADPPSGAIAQRPENHPTAAYGVQLVLFE